jgi:hypothetical protein
MMLSPADVRGTFLNTAALRDDALAESAEAESVAAVIDDPWADDGPADEPAAPAPKRRERPEIFADQMINLWVDQLYRFQKDDKALAGLDLAPEIVDTLINELMVGASRTGLAEDLAELVRRETLSAGIRWIDVADRVAQIAAMRLNDFVAYLSFTHTPAGERPGFPEAPGQQRRSIFSLDDLATPGLEVGETRELLKRRAFLDWGVALRAFGNDNVGHSAGRDISDEQNRRLGEILALVDIGSRRAQ